MAKFTKSQKTAKSKKWTRVEKAKASTARNLDQSALFLISETREIFIKLR